LAIPSNQTALRFRHATRPGQRAGAPRFRWARAPAKNYSVNIEDEMRRRIWINA